MKSSDFKNQFGKDSYLELNNIKKSLFKEKKALIEKFKSRQATNLNSIHYVYELNQYFTKNNKIDEHLKTTINSTLFMIMQYFINLNNTKALISQNLEYIEYENKKIFSKELDLLITHSKIILENIDYLNKIKNMSDKLNLKQKIEDAHNELIYKYENKFFLSKIYLFIFLFICYFDGYTNL